jgi:hypothetical protein
MAENWYYIRNNQRFGPCTSSELKQLALSGNLSRHDLIWKEGMQVWSPADCLAGLFPKGLPPVPPPPPVAKLPSPLAGAAISSLPTIDTTPSAQRTAAAIGTPDSSNAFAIAGLSLGVTGAVISIVPCVFLVGIAPDVLGILFSIIALTRVNVRTGGGKGMALGGLACGLVGVLLWFAQMSHINNVTETFHDEMKKAGQEWNREMRKAGQEFERDMDQLRRDMNRRF